MAVAAVAAASVAIQPLSDLRGGYHRSRRETVRRWAELGLTGNEYAVYTLLWDTANRDGVSCLTLTEMQRFLRWRRDKIVAALRRLAEVGLIACERRAPRRNVYRVLVLVPAAGSGCAAADASAQISPAPPTLACPSVVSQRDDGGPTPGRPIEDSPTIHERQNNNQPPTHTSAVVVPLSSPALEAVCAAYEAAVGRPIRRAYALALLRKHGLDDVLAKIRLLADAANRSLIRNPEGWLRQALREDWQPPQAVSRGRLEAERARREAEAALAEVAAARSAYEATPPERRRLILAQVWSALPPHMRRRRGEAR